MFLMIFFTVCKWIPWEKKQPETLSCQILHQYQSVSPVCLKLIIIAWVNSSWIWCLNPNRNNDHTIPGASPVSWIWTPTHFIFPTTVKMSCPLATSHSRDAPTINFHELIFLLDRCFTGGEEASINGVQLNCGENLLGDNRLSHRGPFYELIDLCLDFIPNSRITLNVISISLKCVDLFLADLRHTT